MIDLLIFDFDGLIIDTETPDYLSWEEVFRHYHEELPLDRWNEAIGQRADVFDPFGYLQARLAVPLERSEIESQRRARFHQLVNEESLRPGIASYLDDAHARGIRCAVASSATRVWVEGHLRRFGIYDRFECIKTIEDVQHAKPAPDLFLAVLNVMNTSAQRAIVLEDSPNGLFAAKRAGVFAVAVPNTVTSSLDVGHADLTVSSLTAWPLERLLAEVERIRTEPINPVR
jgi:HAD superfamily hydrolase (TIGR01509 family)